MTDLDNLIFCYRSQQVVSGCIWSSICEEDGRIWQFGSGKWRPGGFFSRFVRTLGTGSSASSALRPLILFGRPPRQGF